MLRSNLVFAFFRYFGGKHLITGHLLILEGIVLLCWHESCFISKKDLVVLAMNVQFIGHQNESTYYSLGRATSYLYDIERTTNQ